MIVKLKRQGKENLYHGNETKSSGTRSGTNNKKGNEKTKSEGLREQKNWRAMPRRARRRQREAVGKKF